MAHVHPVHKTPRGGDLSLPLEVWAAYVHRLELGENGVWLRIHLRLGLSRDNFLQLLATRGIEIIQEDGRMWARFGSEGYTGLIIVEDHRPWAG